MRNRGFNFEVQLATEPRAVATGQIFNRIISMSVTAGLRWKQRTRINLSTWPVATALGSDVDFDEHRYSDSNVTVGSNISRRVSELLHFKLEFTNDN